MSVDGKISTGSVDERDVDKDFPNINGVSQGLHQYYELEKQTDFYSLNTGKVQAKIGVNDKKEVAKTVINFIVIDNEPHLTDVGVDYFIQKSKKFFLITTNKSHPAFRRKEADNLEIICYENQIDFEDLFEKFKSDYGIDAITIQSGGSLNARLLRGGLIDHVSIVVAPCLIGGSETATLVDGKSLSTVDDLKMIKPLVLKECEALQDSYIHLQYDVLK
jgi:2,5-diamino-6-(ribosylamino)-4(3H)-pyrimidinone 5'-phosphate reductase